MSLTLLSEKLDKLNEKEKIIRMTYDVRGTNKHQHRYINDLKQDFKEDLELRYGNKPYGLGWNQDSEIETERDADNVDEDGDEPIPEDDEDVEKENGDIMVSAVSPNSNFRPMSGKVSSFAAQNRPFSASTIRPVTASSAGGNGFMFQNRPISAISNVKRHFGSGSGQEMGESALSMKSPQSMHQALSHDDLAKMQASNLTLNQSTKLKASENIFWKNTKKFDVAQSTKQFYTKQLVFDMPHMDPKLINSTDLVFLKGERIHSALESSKLKAPDNHEFQEVAKAISPKKKINMTTGGMEDMDTQPDAKSIFNQSLSYIQSLRNDSKSTKNILAEQQDSNNKARKHQRPVTAHPMISSSAATITNNLKKPLETVKEHVPGNSRIYFSSLSDLRKKAFFLKLHSLESAQLNHPSLSKEVKHIDWECFKDLPNQPDFQSLNLLIVDLNSFDHMRYELEFTESGRVQAKDKEELREVLDVYKDFLHATRTNIASIIIYYEATNNCMLEVFSRVLVYEKQENEYDLIVWRNIYRFLLYKIILANAPLYPDCKTYQDFSKMIKDIIEDKRDYVSPISSQIQQTKDHPIIVERNSHVYNFDFHSYILECSSYYAQSLQRDPLKHEPSYKPSRKESNVNNENKKARPYSAIDPKNKFPMFANKQPPKLQDTTLKETSNTFDPFTLLAPYKPSSPFNNTMTSTTRNNASKDRLATTLGNMTIGGSQPILPMNRRSIPKSPEMKDVRVQPNVDFTVQGGRMDIYPDMWAASSSAKSKWKNTMMSTSFAPDYKKFSSSAMQTPKGFEGIFQPDPNGVIVRQNFNTMKKHTNVVVHRRPYSAQKKPIEPHKSSGNIPITMFLSASGTKPNSKTKF